MDSGGAILAVDIGTTAMKMGLFAPGVAGLEQTADCRFEYAIRTYNDGLFSDVDTALWRDAFLRGCRQLAPGMKEVKGVCLSGTTPGLTAIDREGQALYPAILMLDQRSRAQAERIISRVGLDTFLERTGNMPVAGGCSLAGMLWLKDNEPEVYARTRWFVHSNGFFSAWLTGSPAMDPSSASLSGLYLTARSAPAWDEEIARECGVDPALLPPLIPAHESAGGVRGEIARETGLPSGVPVVIGGNDAVLAAYSVGIEEPGDVINVNGTCEISLVCLPACHGAPSYNVRAHVIPDRWLTLYVMNAQGKAYEWFRGVFCHDMDEREFYEEFLPRSIDQWVESESGVRYVPYLMGSRYSLEPLKAEFTGLTQNTTREELAAALVRDLCYYQRAHLEEIASVVQLNPKTHVTGGALSDALIRAKQRWMRPGEYVREDQSSLRGAALLGRHLLS